MCLQFIKGFTRLPRFLLLFIPELFGPVLECLTLDWPAQDCPAAAAGPFAFSCPPRPFDLLLDGFSCLKQIHLYLNSHLKGPRDLLVAVHAGALTYLPQPNSKPKFLLLVCFVAG